MDNKLSSEEILRLIKQQNIAEQRKKIDFQREVAQSVQALKEEERNWIREVLSDYDPFEIEISPSYFYRMKTIAERNANKEAVRKELNQLREERKTFSPEDLLEFRDKNTRESQDNFLGIYIIHNCDRDCYYIGQAEKILDRVFKHFLKDGGSPEIYRDYRSGDTFVIHLIPLIKTSYSSLNELEDLAIRAYDSLIPFGYNKNPGNIMDQPIFKSEEYEKVANLLLDKIKETDIFWNLSNDQKRRRYTMTLLKELVVRDNPHFTRTFMDLIKAYRKANKSLKK
jgi:hypothetical protein